MVDLLQKYDIQTLLIILILFLIGLKQILEGFDYFWKKITTYFDGRHTFQNNKNNFEKELKTHEQQLDVLYTKVNKINEKLDAIVSKMNLLMESDKDDIKAYITREYHYFTEQKKWIDDYSLDCIEKRYSHYVDEGGNSFIEGCMEALRALPRTPPEKQQQQ